MPDQLSQPCGSRDDLRIEQSRCLPNRYNESGCRRCVVTCPRQAVSVDDGLRVNPERCTGCLLCTTVCPSGALEINQPFDTCLAALRKIEKPTLGCCRTSASANATLACLGGISDEHLLCLTNGLNGSLQLNLSSCQTCPNGSMLEQLHERLRRLAEQRYDQSGCRITIVEDGATLHVQQEQLNRRNFFSSFRSVLFQSAAVVVNATQQSAEHRSEYAEKRVPERRQLLNRTLRALATEPRQRLTAHYSHQLSFNDNCSACQSCVASCPTGALRTKDRKQQPEFLQENCTGCGLCVEFCIDQAITLSPVRN